jgi:hypothetical protein
MAEAAHAVQTIPRALSLTSVHVNVIIVTRRAGQHHTMRVEGRCRYGRAARLVQERRVGLHTGEEIARKVEYLDGMVLSSSV